MKTKNGGNKGTKKDNKLGGDSQSTNFLSLGAGALPSIGSGMNSHVPGMSKEILMRQIEEEEEKEAK